MSRALYWEWVGSRESVEIHKVGLVHTSKLCHSTQLSWVMKQMFLYSSKFSCGWFRTICATLNCFQARKGPLDIFCWFSSSPIHVHPPVWALKAALVHSVYRFPSVEFPVDLANGMHQEIRGWGKNKVVRVGCAPLTKQPPIKQPSRAVLERF